MKFLHFILWNLKRLHHCSIECSHPEESLIVHKSQACPCAPSMHATLRPFSYNLSWKSRCPLFLCDLRMFQSFNYYGFYWTPNKGENCALTLPCFGSWTSTQLYLFLRQASTPSVNINWKSLKIAKRGELPVYSSHSAIPLPLFSKFCLPLLKREKCSMYM